MRPTEMAAVVYAGGGGCCASCWYSSDVWLLAAERAEAALAGRLTGRLAELRDSTDESGCTAAPGRGLEVLGVTSRDGAMESAFAFEASGAAGMAAFMRDEHGWLIDGGGAWAPTAIAASPGSWPPAV
jgi:hypothetical protein